MLAEGKSEGDMRLPSKEEVAAYISESADLPQERRLEIEKLAAEDPELAAKIAVLRSLTSSYLSGDVGPLAASAEALGIAPDDLLPDESETVAQMVVTLCRGAVSLDEARAYAIYHIEEADEGDAEGKQGETHGAELDPRMLAAVVRAGIFPDIAQAKEAVVKVLLHLGPLLQKLGGTGAVPPEVGKMEELFGSEDAPE